ncbi:SEC-C metal-binding domain-containing protein [Natranaerobius thermophilus]|uniref:SEC-C motif domain protein n=1 Tax=Natranaerobius thermophilus (strain ATCC BAA-1301 / DSM 18059 / JW/NM-WN-LF) TaxID=457570 RepID=B2A1S6_NATTJ|nr:SEC-C metal-binding domain-containing protein [Natranaerobius thermophilus]ACB86123.1 SEC-C motif domain protein [Natranaerobius thermophilus JW/NM-WN-LF]
MNQRIGKPFYIPPRKELLKYKNDTYFEVNKEYKALLNYLKKNIFDGDKAAAEGLCEDIQGICQFGFSLNRVFDQFNNRGVEFDSEEQAQEVMQLVIDLSNNTRLWEHNGHTPSELHQKKDKFQKKHIPNQKNKPRRVGKKIGRNEPCPCGSGKKYKKCCLD